VKLQAVFYSFHRLIVNFVLTMRHPNILTIELQLLGSKSVMDVEALATQSPRSSMVNKSPNETFVDSGRVSETTYLVH
jgi:hypothetical protein